MYWGGLLCVFASSPSSTRLGSKAKWVVLDWMTGIQFMTHMLMAYHGIWFVWYAYDQIFSRMPCGTYHFFFVPVLDPSPSFWFLRDFLTQLICPLAMPLLVMFPFMGLLVASEIKKSIQVSTTYQMFFPTSNDLGTQQSEITAPNPSVKFSLRCRILRRLKRLYHGIRELYRQLWRLIGLPSYGGSGIRLMTPIDIKNRRYVLGTYQKRPRMLTPVKNLSYPLRCTRNSLLRYVHDCY